MAIGENFAGNDRTKIGTGLTGGTLNGGGKKASPIVSSSQNAATPGWTLPSSKGKKNIGAINIEN